MNARVVDTNVLLIASERAPQAGPACVKACVATLQQVTQSERISIDDGFRIINEYRNKNSPSGEPGVGDAFLRWVLTNRANPERCEMVSIRARGTGREDYEEFPDEPELGGFDPSDRKFVAVARGSRHQPPITVGIERGWWKHLEILARHGVVVDVLCPEHHKNPS